MSQGFTQSDVEAYQARRASAKGLQKMRGPAFEIATLPAKVAPREAVIQEQIANHLRSLGRECYFVWHRTDRPTTCAIGTPDFVGWLRGRPFAMEVKKPGGKQTREQAGALMQAQLAGAKSRVVHSLAEAVEFLKTTHNRGDADRE